MNKQKKPATAIASCSYFFSNHCGGLLRLLLCAGAPVFRTHTITQLPTDYLGV
jgi:hypothetical protein